MRIAISATFWSQPTVGSGQYLRGLLRGLRQVAPEHELILLLPAFLHEERPSAAGPVASGQGSVVTLRTPFDGRSSNFAKLWFEQVAAPRAAARLGADLLHVPYAAPPLASPVPAVVTIHDIIPLLLPEYRGRRAVRAYMRLIAPGARRAAHVIADSEHSRRDIVAHLGCAPERVTTVLLAADELFRPMGPTEARARAADGYGLRGPFVYYVGGLDARKNVATLVRAFGRMRHAGGPDALLAIAGRSVGADPRLFPDIAAVIAEQGLEGAVRRIDVPRADGPLLYSAATAFAWPSRYEGFGLPPLEAMACGAPTVVADASSLPEVVGDAALLVPPDDEAGWAAALWRILADERLRADLRARGLRRAAQFSYEQVARETLAIYTTICEGPRRFTTS